MEIITQHGDDEGGDGGNITNQSAVSAAAEVVSEPERAAQQRYLTDSLFVTQPEGGDMQSNADGGKETQKVLIKRRTLRV